MIQNNRNYPAYKMLDSSYKSRSVSVTCSYAQAVEIANIFYYVNKLPKWLGGLKLSDELWALHNSIHNAHVNAALSIEALIHIDNGGKCDI
jgi:hypothetical protein